MLMLSNSNQREGDGKEEKEKLHSLKPPSLMGRERWATEEGWPCPESCKERIPLNKNVLVNEEKPLPQVYDPL